MPGPLDYLRSGFRGARDALFGAPEEPTVGQVLQRGMTREAFRGGMELTPEKRQQAEDDFIRRFLELKREADRMGLQYSAPNDPAAKWDAAERARQTKRK